jgi:hypothetical protein
LRAASRFVVSSDSASRQSALLFYLIAGKVQELREEKLDAASLTPRKDVFSRAVELCPVWWSITPNSQGFSPGIGAQKLCVVAGTQATPG